MQVQGTWRVELDGLGTDLRYGSQRLQADAFLRAEATGHVRLLRENIDLPFRVERRVGASVALGELRYSGEHEAIVGDLQDLAVHLGDHVVLQLVARLVEYGLDKRLPVENPIALLEKEKVSGLVSPMGGMFRVEMGIDRLDVRVDEDTLTLEVRFGFAQPQLTDGRAEA